MSLRFYWSEQHGRLEPACESDTVDRDGVSILASLLTDTGGTRYLDTLPWLDEGLRRLDAVKRGELPSARWGREDWGASFTSNRVEVFSLHDESFATVLRVETFERALRMWIEFLRGVPDVENTLVV